jgi:hypothetical protein
MDFIHAASTGSGGRSTRLPKNVIRASFFKDIVIFRCIGRAMSTGLQLAPPEAKCENTPSTRIGLEKTWEM